ncbi:TPA: hypothetical protein QCX89_003207 [Bacillus cereus]|nr:hypothetical protein [Bacillus cereus]
MINLQKLKSFMLVGAILLISTLFLGLTSVSAQANLDYSAKSLKPDKYEPTGDPSIGYPQMVIRTNRTAERTNFEEVIQKANQVANQYPTNDKENRAKAVTKELNKMFGSGAFGHTWIIFFNSPKKGDYTSYGYHAGLGFVKNGKNDSPERKFHLERVLPMKDTSKYPDQLEKTIISNLNKQSAEIAKIMGIPVNDPNNGAYTPINNCTWFAGNLWNYATNDNLVFEQDFDGASHADDWGMPFLNMINKVGDPGMVAESIAQ